MRDLRIAHIADTHLGYRSGTVSGRDEDFSHSWKSACRAIVDSKPDMIIHAGDVFHHPNPSWAAVVDFLDGAAILKEAEAPIFLISGNHDSSRINLKRTIFSVLSEVVPYVTVCHEDHPVLYHNRPLRAQLLLVSHRALINPTLRDDLEATLPLIDEDEHTILVSHGSVGNLDKSTEMGSVVVPDFLFTYPWSYIALGHLHMAQPFGQNGWYSGSIERCGWGDYPASPAWTIVTLSHGKPIRHTQQPVPHLRFVQLPDLDCRGWQDEDIVEAVVYEARRSVSPDERALVRILLKGISQRGQRTLSNSISRLLKTSHPLVQFTLTLEGGSIFEPQQMGEQREKIISLADAFREYMAGREFETEIEKSWAIEKGLDALSRAQQAEADGDTGDERSVPLG